ncbi:Rpn family recombination-promoting nuclease/putative transposase [Gloeobacter violaceus]|uniref:Gll0478 protein n=1 Tax=Gloeobacter violaceus (strain ATCC 29082 / PCC 7421) TaxID=251221 RepID=Q7NND3_GLOVI|nr:Rpn family recombination-promoting nuclease/putative transposase [Gloeobacter violaceus]BAC88419.1 gll0478 [Gloeobacter violaceus PCC 7421]
MKTDTLFYRLFQTFPATLFELLGADPALAFDYEFRSVELKQTAFRLDGVFVPTTPDRPLYFVEVQFQPDRRFYSRLFTEIFLYIHQLAPASDWRVLVLFPGRSADPADQPAFADLLSGSRVQRLYLDELEPGLSPSLGVGLVRLVVEDERSAVARARQLLVQAVREPMDEAARRQALELIETFIVYKLPQMSRQEIEAMFGLDELKQTRYFQDVQAEARQEEALALVTRLLTKRFGPPDATVQQRLRELSLEQIEALGEALLDFKEEADLRAWLAALSKRG